MSTTKVNGSANSCAVRDDAHGTKSAARGCSRPLRPAGRHVPAQRARHGDIRVAALPGRSAQIDMALGHRELLLPSSLQGRERHRVRPHGINREAAVPAGQWLRPETQGRRHCVAVAATPVA
ncbi:hypothetical protein GCM10010254_26500 [Streptomyces chromofuscus]|nr:hypothetical protein GCM10010254_26500 [Streptomyces chromofuscus]